MSDKKADADLDGAYHTQWDTETEMYTGTVEWTCYENDGSYTVEARFVFEGAEKLSNEEQLDRAIMAAKDSCPPNNQADFGG